MVLTQLSVIQLKKGFELLGILSGCNNWLDLPKMGCLFIGAIMTVTKQN